MVGKLWQNRRNIRRIIMRLYLNVPYSEKDEAKALGAKWNVKAKKWYTDLEFRT